jgi:hypothetical protein
MAHDSVINALINVGLRQKELQNVLASNVGLYRGSSELLTFI